MTARAHVTTVRSPGAPEAGPSVAAPAPPGEREAEESAADATIERLLEHVPAPAAEAAPTLEPAPAVEPAPALRTARIVGLGTDTAQIAWRGRSAAIEAELDAGVDRALLEQAMENGDLALVEVDPVEGPLVIGVVQRRIPTNTTIRGETVTIEAEREILLRAGRGAMRIREDGDVEVVGSRILTMSRGLFRIVGRVLRLN